MAPKASWLRPEPRRAALSSRLHSLDRLARDGAHYAADRLERRGSASLQAPITFGLRRAGTVNAGDQPPQIRRYRTGAAHDLADCPESSLRRYDNMVAFDVPVVREAVAATLWRELEVREQYSTKRASLPVTGYPRFGRVVPRRGGRSLWSCGRIA